MSEIKILQNEIIGEVTLAFIFFGGDIRSDRNSFEDLKIEHHKDKQTHFYLSY